MKNKVWIEKELFLFYDKYKKIKKMDLWFGIIPFISKNSTDIKKYFSNIIKIIVKNRKFKKMIIGFDIAHYKNTNNNLFLLDDDIKYVKDELKINDIKINFLFHAGENDNENSKLDMEYAYENGWNRIGHGIHWLNIDKFIKKKIMLEICPISNLYFKNIESLQHYEYIVNNAIFSINSDDCNKFNDWDLNDNFYIMCNHFKFNKKKIKTIIKNWINYCYASKKIKKIMLLKLKNFYKKWKK